MKLFLYIIPVSIIVMAHSCSKKDIQLKEGTIEIAVERCGSGDIGGDTIRLCFDSLISDSRCPANAICVWAGSALAKFSLTKNGESTSFNLATLKYGSYNKDTVIMGYKIEFVNLSPYPGTVSTPVPADRIKAEIKITRQ
jgi:hypothetical protein